MTNTCCYNSFSFNNGETIEINSNDVIVFVGSNNVGKSVALKNIFISKHTLSENNLFSVITNTKLTSDYSFVEFVTFLKSSEFCHEDSAGRVSFNIAQYSSLNEQQLFKQWEHMSLRNNLFRDVFFKFLDTKARLIGSNAVDTIDFVNQKARVPLQKLYINDQLEIIISSYFQQAFNLELIVSRLSGKKIHLHIGQTPSMAENENILSTSYQSRIQKLPLLEAQGDGMRSFTSIILELFTQNSSVVFIDEPEAFLHPPQAKLLGKLIGKELTNKQIFLSTHSSDFIKGLLESNKEDIKIIRIQRDGQKNIPSLLNNDDIKTLWKDPILRHSQIIDGVFHENVFICESEGDCRFFSALLDSIFKDDPRSSRISDTLFIASHGKQKIPTVVNALKKLSVPTISICDFDIFNNEHPLKELVESHGGNWNDIEKRWRIFFKAINQEKSQLNRAEVKDKIDAIFGKTNKNVLSLNEIDNVKEIIKQSSPWSFAKAKGLAFVPQGEPYVACIDTIKMLNSIGIYPIKIGELESFDRSVSNSNKSKWLDEVLQKNMKTDTNLQQAREFVIEIVDKVFGSV
ncbi:hypothetical protein GCM10023093_06290 [Nemorincola caseinilytica]|uniref:ATPase AAA-type core domain-containing protein n=1 Tax=Nemorincola caseinilytica TaxID=2054315 RepID=A0ABP8N8L7_9BACT